MEPPKALHCIRVIVFFLFLGVPEFLNILRLLWKFKSFIKHIFPFKFVPVHNDEKSTHNLARNQRVYIESMFDKADHPETSTVQVNSACPPLFRSYSSPCIFQQPKIHLMYQQESASMTEREQAVPSPKNVENVSPLSIGLSAFQEPITKSMNGQDSLSVSPSKQSQDYPEDMSDVSPVSLKLSVFGNESNTTRKREASKRLSEGMRIETLHSAAQCLQNLLDLQIEMFGEVRRENKVWGCELEQLSKKMNVLTDEVNHFRRILSDVRNDLLHTRQREEQLKTSDVMEKPNDLTKNITKNDSCDKDLKGSSRHAESERGNGQPNEPSSCTSIKKVSCIRVVNST